jgi:hypothetical protein
VVNTACTFGLGYKRRNSCELVLRTLVVLLSFTSLFIRFPQVEGFLLQLLNQGGYYFWFQLPEFWAASRVTWAGFMEFIFHPVRSGRGSRPLQDYYSLIVKDFSPSHGRYLPSLQFDSV